MLVYLKKNTVNIKGFWSSIFKVYNIIIFKFIKPKLKLDLKKKNQICNVGMCATHDLSKYTCNCIH